MEAELQNHLKWAGRKITQNFIDFLFMSRDVTHDKKETKQGEMALVECAIELFTTGKKPLESIKDY